MQKACAYDVRKALIRDLLISIHKTRGFEWQTAHTKGCLENRCVKVDTEDIYADMSLNADLYDTSNYSPGHPLFSNTNKKIIGKFKDELGGKVMTEFIGLRPKMYSYAGEDSGKRAKGVKKSVLCKTITHEDYRSCLLRKKCSSVTCPA